MKAKKALRIVLAILLLAVLGGCIFLNGLLPIVTGYPAKNLASNVFVSGREQADVEATDLNFSIIRFARNKVDRAHRTVTSRFLWSKSTAILREGYGVTLLRGKDQAEFKGKTLRRKPSAPNPLAVGDSAFSARLKPVAEALVDRQAYGGTPFAFVVLQDGAVVAERYRDGFNAQTKLLSWSMAKSFTNAVLGLMVGDGKVDIETPMNVPLWQGDGRKAITLKNVIQMQSGLAWNEDYGTRSDVNLMLFKQADMGLYAMSKPLEHEPGSYWYYSSGSTNIVMRYLRDRFASPDDFMAYIHERLFAPLGFQDAVFEPDMSGTPIGSSYLYATARDFARFGQLYLDDGCIGENRILPEGWVGFTTTPASASGGQYGAFFWLNRSKTYPDAPEDMFECRGHDGQEIFIIPSRKLVVAILGYSPKPDRTINFNALLRDILTAE